MESKPKLLPSPNTKWTTVTNLPDGNMKAPVRYLICWKEMDVRARLIRTNTDLLQELDKVSKLNEKITEQEIFTADTQHSTNEELTRSKRELKQAEDNISHLSDNINEYAFSKEGVGIQNMVNEWLLAVINEAKAQAELKVLEDRRKDIREGYKPYLLLERKSTAKSVR